tara:strand:+ start:118 stop:861 length:744 start_codon:yes stop_codon:yes gene_type:complete
MAKIKKKPTPKKIKTLIPEPNWEKFSKFTDEEKQLDAYKQASDFVHYEVSDKDALASLKVWIRKQSGWDLHEETKTLPDTFMLPFAKYGFIAVELGYMPKKIFSSLEKNLKPLLLRAEVLRSRVQSDPLLHSDIVALDKDHFLSEEKVREWAETAKKYISANKKDAEGKDPHRRIALQNAETYLANIRTYLRTGIWNDLFYGENREKKTMWVCKSLAYDENGIVKRTVGTYYPDIGMIWTKELSNET